MLLAFVLVAALAAGCQKAPEQRGPTVTLRLAGYTAVREVYGEAIIPAFARHWKAKTGQEVLFEESYLASRAQAQAILDGLDADVAALALEGDVDILARAGLVDPDWKFSESGGMFSQSVVVLAVRAGNPMGIHDWPDLGKAGVRVMTPDPRTSGGGRWNVCAIYGAALRGYAGARRFRNDDARGLLGRVFGNVTPMERGARESFERFERGTGDVAITYESEAIAATRARLPVEYVIPRSTVVVELPVAMVRKNVERHGTREIAKEFLAFLKGEEAQRAFVEYGLRAVDPAVVKETGSRYPPVEDLWTIGFLGGWAKVTEDLFGADGAFTQVYETMHAAE